MWQVVSSRPKHQVLPVPAVLTELAEKSPEENLSRLGSGVIPSHSAEILHSSETSEVSSLVTSSQNSKRYTWQRWNNMTVGLDVVDVKQPRLETLPYVAIRCCWCSLRVCVCVHVCLCVRVCVCHYEMHVSTPFYPYIHVCILSMFVVMHPHISMDRVPRSTNAGRRMANS